MQELNFQQKSVLELMKEHAKALEDASRTLDDKAQQNISVSSIIVAIVGALNLKSSIGGQVAQATLSQPFIISIFLVYGLIFILSYVVRYPRKFATHPLKPTWKEAQAWLKLEHEDYYDKVVASYVDIVEVNKKITDYKAVLVQIAAFFVGVDVFLIFVAVLSHSA